MWVLYIPGVPTGLNDLNKLLDGFQPAELPVTSSNDFLVTRILLPHNNESTYRPS